MVSKLIGWWLHLPQNSWTTHRTGGRSGARTFFLSWLLACLCSFLLSFSKQQSLLPVEGCWEGCCRPWSFMEKTGNSGFTQLKSFRHIADHQSVGDKLHPWSLSSVLRPQKGLLDSPWTLSWWEAGRRLFSLGSPGDSSLIPVTGYWLLFGVLAELFLWARQKNWASRKNRKPNQRERGSNSFSLWDKWSLRMGLLDMLT